MYEHEIDQNRSMPSYQRLKTMVRRHIGHTIRTRSIRVRSEKIETGVLVKSQKKENVSLEMGLGECYQWKAKGQCSGGDACSSRHEDDQCGKKAQSRPLLLQDRRLIVTLRKETSHRRSSPPGKKSQRPCTNYLKGICTNPSCD